MTTTQLPRGAGPASPAAVAAAREALDAHVREVIAWHFDPATGCPFWLERAAGLGWDPRREVKGFADLARFEPFQAGWLAEAPVARWVPRGLAGQPIHAFEVGGAAGPPRLRVGVEDFRVDYAGIGRVLSDEAFPPGADWLAMSPTGPRRLRLCMEHLAQARGGIAFGLDFDPRWVARCLKRGAARSVEAYRGHVVDQALTILRAHPNVRCLFATPRLLEALAEKVSLRQVGLTGVLCEGFPMSASWLEKAREDLLDGLAFVPLYSPALAAPACPRPFVEGEGFAITFHAQQPRCVLEVAGGDGAGDVVPHGSAGRVRVTTLTRELFLPRFIERHEAVRTGPIELFPWDGISGVSPVSGSDGVAGDGDS